MRRLLLVLTILASSAAATSAHAQAPDAGVAFDPPPLPAAQYAVQSPTADAKQVRKITAPDGTTLHSDTWLPVQKEGGPKPPERLPVVMLYSPYSRQGSAEDQKRVETLVSRGFAFTQAHVRGSGGSGGCIAQTDQHEVADGALFVKDAGELAPWASGNVGMYGGSYRGGTQIATAVGPDRDALKSLKALVVGNPVASNYDFFNTDGVPHLAQAEANVPVYALLLASPQDNPAALPERPGCQPAQQLEAAAGNGDYTRRYAERDHTANLDRLEAATLMWHGHADTRVGAHMQLGLFDRIPKTTPKHGLFGVFDHEQPDRFRGSAPQPRASWERGDWDAMLVAWFDRYLNATRNGVDRWPPVQVQGTDGQWRTAKDWPSGTGGREAALLLGPDGTLGADAPKGTTTYQELPALELDVPGYAPPPGAAATFTTPPLTDRLELTGGPVLDLWVSVDRPDAHLAVAVEALDAEGRRTILEAKTVGARSLRHLDPFTRGRFVQAVGKPAPTNVPINVPVRLRPTDLVVPKGGRLKVTLTGSVQLYDGLDGAIDGLGAIVQGPSAPSGSQTRVTVLHDCTHPSALRFAIPAASSQLLDVREQDEPDGVLGDDPKTPDPVVDGGGLATRAACGAKDAAAAAEGPAFKLTARPVSRSLATSLRKRAVPVKIGCVVACRARAKLTVTKATAERLGLRRRTIAATTKDATIGRAATRTLAMRLTPAARKRLRGTRVIRATVAVTARGDGERTTRRLALRLRR